MQRRARAFTAALLLAGTIAVGAVGVLERRPDPTPLLGTTGSTLARVAVSQDLAPSDRTPSGSDAGERTLAPGFDLGQVLQRDGGGPWYSQVIDPDRVDTPYVADTEVCGGAETVLVASGNVGTDLSGVGVLDDVGVAVPTLWRSAGGTPWTRVTVPEAPRPSSLGAIISARSIGRPDRLIAIGEQLVVGASPYVAVSDDCGSTWRVEKLPGGRGNTVAEAILADGQGVLVVGRTDGTEPFEKSLMVWKAPDPDKPMSFETTIVETDASAALPITFLTRSEQSVIIGLLDPSRRNASLLRWEGTATDTFVPYGERVDVWRPIAIVASAYGPHLLSFGDGGRDLELRRFNVDGERMDRLPRINGQSFRQTRFVSDGGTTLWMIAEREDFVLQAWSITLPDTASCAERDENGRC